MPSETAMEGKMDQLFAQKEDQIQPLMAAQMMVVVGSYTGNSDLTTDKANADTVLDKLFPDRWKESCSLNISGKTVTASGGPCDAAIASPYLYKDDILVDDGLYTFAPGTGIFTFAATPAAGTYTATFVKNIFGANVADPTSDFPNATKDIKAFGAIDPVYSTTEYQDTKHAIKVSGTFDVSALRRTNPIADLEKAVYGSQWSAVSEVENTPARNTNPFFVAIIWWYPEAESDQLEWKKLVYYKCTLNKFIGPMPDGTDNPAKFEVDAVSIYNRITDKHKA
jgi:hypothetical protein